MTGMRSRLRLLLGALLLLASLSLLVSCGEYTRDFYVTPSKTEVAYGESITLENEDPDTLLSSWSFTCSSGFVLDKVEGDTFTVTPTEEGTLYLRLTANDGGPKSQWIKITVTRREETVSTPEQLLAATDASVRYILANDIDLAGVTDHTPFVFCGALDGRGHTIRGFTYTPTELVKDKSLGLFSENSGIIENVTIEGASVGIYSEAASAGILVGVNNGKIRNVTVKGFLAAEQTNHVGGLCGINNGRIEHCVSEATVEGKEMTGGIAGSSVSAINGSENRGFVEGTSAVGGIVGRVTSACTVAGNKNSGEVVGTTYVGGIIGTTDETAIVQINSCENSGEVAGTTYVGGLVGYGKSAAVFGCQNGGVINALSNYAGGIAGNVFSARRCENGGAVSAEGRDLTASNGYFAVYVGGIAGYAREASECTNRQRIEMMAASGSYIGGVIGYLDGTGTGQKLNNNKNEGEITTAISAKYVGGVMGYVKNAALRGTVNEGDVNGGASTAGVVGYLESGGLYFTTNRGAIRAPGETYEICFHSNTESATIFESVTEGETANREDTQ